MRLVIALALMTTGCVHLYSKPVSMRHWNTCITFCEGKVKEACVGFKGNGCKCDDNRVGWFDQDFDDE